MAVRIVLQQLGVHGLQQAELIGEGWRHDGDAVLGEIGSDEWMEGQAGVQRAVKCDRLDGDSRVESEGSPSNNHRRIHAMLLAITGVVHGARAARRHPLLRVRGMRIALLACI